MSICRLASGRRAAPTELPLACVLVFPPRLFHPDRLHHAGEAVQGRPGMSRPAPDRLWLLRRGPLPVWHHTPPQRAGYVDDGCTLIKSMSRTLNLAPSSTLGIYQKLGEKVGHTAMVPRRIDSPEPVRVDRRSLRPLSKLQRWMAEQKNARDPGLPTGG